MKKSGMAAAKEGLCKSRKKMTEGGIISMKIKA